MLVLTISEVEFEDCESTALDRITAAEVLIESDIELEDCADATLV